jgi:heptaprenyl diphosphate synthase
MADPAAPLLAPPTIAADRERIDRALRAAVRTEDAYLDDLASHLIVAGGKRLRPIVAVLASMTDGRPEASDEAVLGGVACELVQVGSLYHDDVMDEADTRRGVETVNAKWGNLQAIVAGDFLLARASAIAASLGTEVAGLLADTIGRLCFGQIGELRTTYQVTRTEDAYFTSIREKTASLYSAAARIGAIVGELPRAQIDDLTAWGLAYGMVFQLVDDVLDLIATDAELGKPAGHDMVEGVYTLPVIRTLAAGGPAGDELSDLLGKPLDHAEREKALSIVRSNGAVHGAVELAAEYVAESKRCADRLPDSPATTALRDAPAALLATVTDR